MNGMKSTHTSAARIFNAVAALLSYILIIPARVKFPAARVGLITCENFGRTEQKSRKTPAATHDRFFCRVQLYKGTIIGFMF